GAIAFGCNAANFRACARGRTMPGGDQIVDLRQRAKRRKLMKKSWKKPTMCTVAVGMEMSRYYSADLKAKK
ncbi:hypothetical protein ABK249_23380, partial [Neorhizobium sp. Rsf11]